MSGEITLVEKLPLQVRETFSESRGTPLGNVQVADELGFAYLGQDIDFGAVGKTEVFQNIKFIILTEYFSVPLDREFGMDYSMVDKPMRIAEAVLTQEVALKISMYEPRAQFREIDFVEEMLVGKLSPSVVVTLLSTEELPGTITPSTAVAVAGPPGVIIEEVDLPGFYEAMIDMARVPGPPGPVGPKGLAATIEVGETVTGAAGTEAEVVNVGDANVAIFDFTIPKGDKGDQGTGITIKGTVPTSSALPATGNQPGDMWIASDTGHGWTWDGDSWVDAGPVQGPVGPPGPQGPQGNTGATGSQGPQGPQGNTGPQGLEGDVGPQGSTGPSNVLTVQSTTTGSPGSNANVNISGTSPAQALAFTIPRGDVGATGSQGLQGPAGTAATATAGTTTTGAPGSNANVVNAGTTSAAVFNFAIPRGDVGAQGPQGPQGIQGIQGAPGAGSGDVVGPASSINSEVALYSGTGGKTIKRATGTGVPVVMNGVWGTPVTDVKDYVPVGSVIQTVYQEVTAEIGTSLLWSDFNFVISEGIELFSLPVTPKYANSKLLVRVSGMLANYKSPAALNIWVVAFYRNDIANSIVNTVGSGYGDGAMSPVTLQYMYTPGSTTTRTYSVRMAGMNSGSSIHLNGYTIVATGYKPISSFTIQEIKQ